jgi:hypothetical protein
MVNTFSPVTKKALRSKGFRKIDTSVEHQPGGHATGLFSRTGINRR